MQCNLRPPEHASPFPLWLRLPGLKWSLNLSLYCRIIALLLLTHYFLLYAVNSTVDPVTLTFDLKHLHCIFTTFDLRQLIRAWIIAFFDADTLCQAMTLTFDPLTVNFYGTSGVMRLNSVQIWEKSNNPQLSYWRFSKFTPYKFRGWGKTDRVFSGVHSPNLTNS